jgi:hypothetical protein
MEKLFIDIFGTGLGIFATILLFETFWVRRNIKPAFFRIGILINATTSIMLLAFLQYTLILPLIAFLLILALSFFYCCNTTYRILLTMLSTSIAFISEMVTSFVLVQILSIPLEEFQADIMIYMYAMLLSKLLALFIVSIIRAIMNGGKQETDKHFNILMVLMPMQSIVLCYVVIDYSLSGGLQGTSSLGITAIILSILLIFVTTSILDRQQKAFTYKREYEMGQARLNMQIEHYQELYKEQEEMKAIRHDIANNMIAISGIIKAGQIHEALDLVDGICQHVIKTTTNVNTGLPPVDAVLSAKIARAKEYDIDIEHSVIIDNDLYVEQFDIAVVLASALDNAIEGIARSVDVEKKIIIHVNRAADYILILIMNNASGPICEDFRTSKPDKKNHGYGMAQMREIVHKYNGSFKPTYDSDTRKFTLNIMLKNRQI